NAVHGAHAPNVPGRGSPGTGAYSRPINRHPLSVPQPQPTGTPSQRPISKTRKRQENPNMKRFLWTYLRSSWLRSPLVTLGFALFLAAPVFAQGTSPWENAVSVLQQAFTSTIARGLSLVAIVVAGLTFAFGEGGSK